VLKDELEGDDAFMRNMASRMFTKFEKYWIDFSTIMIIANILDPRYKLQFAKWVYKKIYVGTHDAHMGLLKDKLFALYDEYAKAWPHLLLLVSLLVCNKALLMGTFRYFFLIYVMFI